MTEDIITVTVSSKEDVQWIRNHVRDGQFASETEAIVSGISVLREEEAALELWLKHTVAARYDQHKLNPAGGISAEQLLSNLEMRRKARAELL